MRRRTQPGAASAPPRECEEHLGDLHLSDPRIKPETDAAPPAAVDRVLVATTTTAATSQVEGRFNQLVEEWWEATGQSSDPEVVLLHPAYEQIINPGPTVLPLIFRELRQRGGLWFRALRELTGEDPVPPEAETMQQVREAWLEFGSRQGYID